MSYDEGLRTISLPANADLSAAQFKFGVINTSGRIEVGNAAGEACHGIIQDKPVAAGEPTKFGVRGVSKVVLGVDSLTPGVEVMTDTSGRAITATAGSRALGVLTLGGDADEVGAVLLYGVPMQRNA